MTRSAIYEGRVEHERRGPRRHRFGYRVALVALDLDEVEQLYRDTPACAFEHAGLFSFRRRDYLGDEATPLADAVKRRVHEVLEFTPAGRVVLVTQARTLGYLFNPVSFYYCHDAADQVCAVVAEITNTPWNERHSYVLDARGRSTGCALEWRFRKDFHVSPFYDMDQTYVWRFTPAGERLEISMSNLEQGAPVFGASLRLERRPWTTRNLLRLLWRYPAQPLRMHLAIYWQAARLYLKRTPFFTHPDKRVALDATSS
ncbi:MAG: DUF1365 domain-containing protein [Planctomycetes bacterium]|nr:DUF1365 domain-containing protein [Planctomycetota bacterium]MCB9903914.1 DUF1365 domain-containing protein [Planctomycetota bacterium]